MPMSTLAQRLAVYVASLAWADEGGVLPALAISGPTAQAEGTGGTTAFTFTLTLTRSGYVGAVPFAWTVAGSGGAPANAADFVGGVLPEGNGTFAAGETVKPITITVVADSTAEPNEGFIVQATATLALGGVTASATITNDDVAAIAGTLDFTLAANSGLITLLLKDP